MPGEWCLNGKWCTVRPLRFLRRITWLSFLLHHHHQRLLWSKNENKIGWDEHEFLSFDFRSQIRSQIQPKDWRNQTVGKTPQSPSFKSFSYPLTRVPVLVPDSRVSFVEGVRRGPDPPLITTVSNSGLGGKDRIGLENGFAWTGISHVNPCTPLLSKGREGNFTFKGDSL